MEKRLNYAPCGFVTITSEGKIVFANQTFLDMVGYPMSEIENQHIEAFMSVANKFLFHSYFYPFIKLYNKVNEVYLTLTSKDGAEVPVLLNGGTYREDPELIDCVFVKINKRIDYEQELRETKRSIEKAYVEKEEALAKLEKLHREIETKQEELIKLNEKLKEQATTDMLTGLKNRRYFHEKLEESLAGYQRYLSPFSLLIIDIDHFKKINDMRGHLVGDQILKELSHMITTTLREIDVVARYGGEEFVVIYPHTNISEAKQRAERLRTEVEKASWQNSNITISIGVTTCTPEDTVTTLIGKADQALYVSKSRGRNCVTHVVDIEAGSNR